MHEKEGVIHRDLKARNMLIDKQLGLVLTDFGFAAYKNIKELNEYKGSRPYMAPEIIVKLKYDGKKVDIFSLGVILFAIVVGKYPFDGADLDNKYYKYIA